MRPLSVTPIPLDWQSTSLTTITNPPSHCLLADSSYLAIKPAVTCFNSRSNICLECFQIVFNALNLINFSCELCDLVIVKTNMLHHVKLEKRTYQWPELFSNFKKPYFGCIFVFFPQNVIIFFFKKIRLYCFSTVKGSHTDYIITNISSLQHN